MWNLVTEMDAWAVKDKAFPATGTPEAKWQHLLCYALLAPSAHNAQPWRFKIVDDQLELYADRTRSLPTVDPHDRELTLSCGAALFQLRLALRHFGYADSAHTFPDPDNPDLLARLSLTHTGKPHANTEEERLFESIPKRHTNRMSYSDTRIPEETLRALEATALHENVWIRIVPQGETRDRLAALISEADRDQLADPQFRHEIAHWARPAHSHDHDGVPGNMLGMPGLIADVGPYLVRTFDTGPLFAARDRQLTLGAPTLVVLGTKTDTPKDWLRAGQAMAHLLLRATAEGVSASFLNPPIELPNLRLKMRDALATTGFPQIMVRLGYGPPIEPTPRRTPEEVLPHEAAT